MKIDIRGIAVDEFPWDADLSEKVKFLLQYAILAPSTHNSQPWLFKIREGSCEIYLNPSLFLPYSDPKNRDQYISLGCATENLILAAKYFGMYKDIKYYENEKYLVAEVFFNEPQRENFNTEYETLIETILVRINARGIFEKVPIPQKTVENILRKLENYLDPSLAIHLIEKDNQIREIASLTARGIEYAYNDPNFRKEMSGWINNSLSLRKQGIPGYALRIPLFFSFILPTLIRISNIGKKLE